MSRFLTRLGLIALILSLCGALAPTWAHGGRPLPPGMDGGIKLPALGHGEMAVVVTYRSAIMRLAAQQTETDPDFRRIGNFIALQDVFCAWGLMPGSIADEDSPFNECSHADLAGVRALLVHMTAMPTARDEANTLLVALDRDVAKADPVLCRFSEEPFSTADVIAPDLLGVIRHLPSLLTVLSGILLSVAAVLLAAAATRPPQRPLGSPASS